MDENRTKEILANYVHQINEALNFGQRIKIERPNKIVVVGVGASGIAGNFLQNIVDSIHVEVVKDYSMPKFVDEKTLVFVLSYSGNSEEAVLCYSDALKKRCKVVIITTNGKLTILARDCPTPPHVVQIPRGYPPRLAFHYLFFPMLTILINNNIVPQMGEEIAMLKQSLSNPEKIFDKASELAKELAGKITLLYSSRILKPVALRWKEMINETAKEHSFVSELPDLTHYELEPSTKGFHVILFKDQTDRKEIQKKMNALKGILSDEKIGVTEINIKGNSYLTRMILSMYLGDVTSYFLAAKKEIDPISTPRTDKYRQRIKLQ